MRVALHASPDKASAQRLYILNSNDSLTTCTPDTSGELSDCSVHGLQDADAVHQMAVNPRTGSVYLLQAGMDSVLICDQNQPTCTIMRGGDVLIDPSFIALNANSTIAYLANADGTLAVCQLGQDGTFSSCTATDVNGTLEIPVAVGLATGNYGTHAYLLNGNAKPVITACKLSPSGMPSTCQAQENERFSTATTMTFSPDGRFLYVGNIHDDLTICTIEQDASLSSCGTIPNADNALFAGIIDITTDCLPYQTEGFLLTTDLALQEKPGSSAAFIASMSNDSVYGCPLDLNGGFGDNCVATTFSD